MFAHEKLGLMLLTASLSVAVYLLFHHLVVARFLRNKSDMNKAGAGLMKKSKDRDDR